MPSKRVSSFDHSRYPSKWKFRGLKKNSSKDVLLRIEKVPLSVTLSPKDAPFDPHDLSGYAGENAAIFCVCPCSATAFKSANARSHWNSQVHEQFIRTHKKCTVKHAFFFNKPEDRDTFLQGGTPTFLEGPDRHGKMRRRRSDDSDDEEYVPKAKRRSSPPLPFSIIAANHHQPYQPSQTPDTLHNLDPLQDL